MSFRIDDILANPYTPPASRGASIDNYDERSYLDLGLPPLTIAEMDDERSSLSLDLSSPSPPPSPIGVKEEPSSPPLGLPCPSLVYSIAGVKDDNLAMSLGLQPRHSIAHSMAGVKNDLHPLDLQAALDLHLHQALALHFLPANGHALTPSPHDASSLQSSPSTRAGDSGSPPRVVKLEPEEEEEQAPPEDYSKRPNISYNVLIAEAIKNSRHGRLRLASIYEYITTKYPYYRNPVCKNWKNSIRHNLSLYKNFLRVPRDDEDNVHGPGSYWTIDPRYAGSTGKLIRRYEKCGVCRAPPAAAVPPPPQPMQQLQSICSPGLLDGLLL